MVSSDQDLVRAGDMDGVHEKQKQNERMNDTNTKSRRVNEMKKVTKTNKH